MSRTSVLKQPVWTWEVPTYAFAAGLAGAASVLAAAGRAPRHRRVARAARRVAAAATLVGPPLLVSDLGRPERFHHMLRVAKPTSPMSVGSWTLAVFGPAAVASAVLSELHRAPRVQRVAETCAAALGPVMATYTAVLFANTAIPVWREAARELPTVFAASAAASAGAATMLATPAADATAARRLAGVGGVIEMVATRRMMRRLGATAEAYHDPDSQRWERAATALTAAGTAFTVRGRRFGRLGALLLLAGSMCQRWAVYRAGFASARMAR